MTNHQIPNLDDTDTASRIVDATLGIYYGENRMDLPDLTDEEYALAVAAEDNLGDLIFDWINHNARQIISEMK